MNGSRHVQKSIGSFPKLSVMNGWNQAAVAIPTCPRVSLINLLHFLRFDGNSSKTISALSFCPCLTCGSLEQPDPPRWRRCLWPTHTGHRSRARAVTLHERQQQNSTIPALGSFPQICDGEFLLRWSVFVFQMPCCGLWACFYDNHHLIPAVCRKAAKIWWEISKPARCMFYNLFITFTYEMSVPGK